MPFETNCRHSSTSKRLLTMPTLRRLYNDALSISSLLPTVNRANRFVFDQSEYDAAVVSGVLPAHFQPSKCILFETDQIYRDKLSCSRDNIDSQAESIVIVFDDSGRLLVEF